MIEVAIGPVNKHKSICGENIQEGCLHYVAKMYRCNFVDKMTKGIVHNMVRHLDGNFCKVEVT